MKSFTFIEEPIMKQEWAALFIFKNISIHFKLSAICDKSKVEKEIW